MVDTKGKRVYTWSCETTSGNDSHRNLWFCCATKQLHISIQNGVHKVLTGGLPQVVQTLPDGLMYSVLYFPKGASNVWQH